MNIARDAANKKKDKGRTDFLRVEKNDREEEGETHDRRLKLGAHTADSRTIAHFILVDQERGKERGKVGT